MTTVNRDLFVHDPLDSKIPNDGVAQVVRPETDQQWDVLTWELKSFVCESEYERGLDRILTSFMTNLSQAKQPAVWVSGFYGSGKSHLVRMLEYLWRDVTMPSGESARNLVDAPATIRDHLAELTLAGRRQGGLWSAAGTLGAGSKDAVRLAFLAVLFESAGLPKQYPHARFVLWATENGLLGAVQTALAAAGKTLEREVLNLYVSPIIGQALLDADSSLGGSVQDIRELLMAQFPPTTSDITDDEMFAAMDDVLRLKSTTADKWPLTLIVLDEMQQYIGDDNVKAITVQNIVEGVSARFKSQVLFVATGQSALTSTPTLSKLTDRFAVQVSLSDQDVDTVVRQVILRKRPEHMAALEGALDHVSGEIDRHLAGTQLAPKAADKQDLGAGYPLLPTRRRFWGWALRAIDRAGKAGVLRTQLKVVHEAVRSVADLPVGHVVGGDFLYEQQSAAMLQTGVLLKEIDELIRGLRSEGPDGVLKSRICALVFLITQIPHRTMGGETGLRATAPFIADLLVEDLANDGAVLRKRVPELLDALVADGHLMRVDDAYAIQTEEGAEWEKEYRRRLAVVRDDAARLGQLRGERLGHAVNQAFGGLRLTHGVSKTPRTVKLHSGQAEPSFADGEVPVWVRDEWSVTEAAVKQTAMEAGTDSPIVHVFVPRWEADAIKDALASHAAALDTVQQKPTPQTDEGRAAERAMKTRLALDEERLVQLFKSVVARTRVLQGGGGEVTTTTPRDAVETAATRSLVRLFPKFAAADHPNWGTVVTKARDGAPDALNAVGHQGAPSAHPVCKEVLATISAGGTKGADLQRHFSGSGYGWPRDAVNGAVLTLLAAGNVRVRTEDGTYLGGPKELPPTQIGKVTIYKEDEPPTMSQRLAVKGLMAEAGIPCASGQEAAQIPALLQRLKDLAGRAGGPPPLPAPPDVTHVAALQSLGGNQLVKAVADRHDDLKADLVRWREAERQRERREEQWRDLGRLLRHADGLPAAAGAVLAADAIRAGRTLLSDPDPVKPLLADVASALRSELTQHVAALGDARRRAAAALETWDDWSRIEPVQRQALLAEAQLEEAPAPEMATDVQLLAALDAVPLRSWADQNSLVASRRDLVRQRAATLLEPESVSVAPPRATLKSGQDLEAYLDRLRQEVQPHLAAGKTVII